MTNSGRLAGRAPGGWRWGASASGHTRSAVAAGNCAPSILRFGLDQEREQVIQQRLDARIDLRFRCLQFQVVELALRETPVQARRTRILEISDHEIDPRV